MNDEPTDLGMTPADGPDQSYALCLYVAGQTPNSIVAIANLHRLAKTHLEGRYTIEVIDLYQQPERAREDRILAVPTLIRKLPPPMRQVIGNLADTERVLVGLDLRPR